MSTGIISSDSSIKLSLSKLSSLYNIGDEYKNLMNFNPSHELNSILLSCISFNFILASIIFKGLSSSSLHPKYDKSFFI